MDRKAGRQMILQIQEIRDSKDKESKGCKEHWWVTRDSIKEIFAKANYDEYHSREEFNKWMEEAGVARYYLSHLETHDFNKPYFVQVMTYYDRIGNGHSLAFDTRGFLLNDEGKTIHKYIINN